jgi:cobalamin biosynthesis protein CobD/CbiB
MGLSHATVMLVLALAIDGAFGELPNRLHPVAWFGALAARLRATLPLAPPAPALLGGVALVAAGVACVGVLLVTDALLRERVPLLTDLAALFWLQASFAARGPAHRGRARRTGPRGGRPFAGSRAARGALQP